MTSQPTSPDDRATEFKPVEGASAQEHYKGETLLVYAYAGIWLMLMFWLFQMWKTQRRIAGRIDGLETAISRATSRKEPTDLVEKKKSESV
jgi:hypothetical protein